MSQLSELEQDVVGEAEISKLMGISTSTLRNRHSRGLNSKHPPAIPGTRPKRYSLTVFQRWIAESGFQSMQRGSKKAA